jgi:hypothetical protein
MRQRDRRGVVQTTQRYLSQVGDSEWLAEGHVRRDAWLRGGYMHGRHVAPIADSRLAEVKERTARRQALVSRRFKPRRCGHWLTGLDEGHTTH